MEKCVLLFQLLLLSRAVWCFEVTMVNTTAGMVRGARDESGEYSMYVGIPYAQVDKSNPFGDALLQPEFEGIFEATTESPPCPQADFYTGAVTGSLNCLTVNVYVPTSAHLTSELPVMVWIHGGAFAVGSNSKAVFGPDFLVNKDVILVTVNYRVGVYGFMCLDTPSVPGNTGLKDQQLALRWVRYNIAAFGGDPHQVTLFGESAGGISVEFHMLNNESNDLFSKVILLSGTVFTDGALEGSDPERPLKLARQVGFSPRDTDEALSIIRTMEPTELVSAGFHLGETYRPCIEKNFKGVYSFMTTVPEKILKSKKYKPKPMIVGYVSSETINSNENKDIASAISKRFKFSKKQEREEAIGLVTEFYLGHDSSEQGIIDFDSDFTNNYGVDKSILYHLEHSGDYPIYQYVFGYVGSASAFADVGHEEELHYLFQLAGGTYTSTDVAVVKEFTKMWTDFAKTGDPTPTDESALKWPPVDRHTRQYFWIDQESRVEHDIYHSRVAFWKLFYVAYGRYYRIQ